IRLEVRAEREERQVRGAGGVPRDHPEVAVLLDLELRRGCLDPAPDRVEPTDPRISQPREHELAGDAARDHLVVDHVGCEPGERQVALALADDLVPGGEADEVREALDRDRVAVADELRDGVAHRGDLAHEAIMPAGTPRRRPGPLESSCACTDNPCSCTYL